MEDRSELNQVEDDAIALLKGRLSEGKIRSTELKILLEILEKRNSAIPKGTPLDELRKDLPFETEDRIVE